MKSKKIKRIAALLCSKKILAHFWRILYDSHRTCDWRISGEKPQGARGSMTADRLGSFFWRAQAVFCYEVSSKTRQ